LHWFQREWSFRAKEHFRNEVERRQGGTCACCGAKGSGLELNHIKKVRDWGRTVGENLEALCQPCHRYVDSRGFRCHSNVSRLAVGPNSK
jgi:5-methylcytosine-specific restriction endonuclease McrA